MMVLEVAWMDRCRVHAARIGGWIGPSHRFRGKKGFALHPAYVVGGGHEEHAQKWSYTFWAASSISSSIMSATSTRTIVPLRQRI